MFARLPGTDAFRHRDFHLYWGARFISALATQIQGVAVGWWVYDLTGDPFALGLVGLALFLPAVALALITGQVALWSRWFPALRDRDRLTITPPGPT